MTSNIDPTKPADGVSAVKFDLRNNLQAAKDEIEDLQARELHASEYGVVADGVTDDGAAVALAMIASEQQNKPLRFPAGDVKIDTTVDFDFRIANPNGVLRVLSDGGTRFILDGGAMAFRMPVNLTTTLAQNADRGVFSVELTSVTGLEVDDLLHFDTATPVESGWGYFKQCLRRVLSIDGTTVSLDQKLDFFFTTAESTEVRAYKPCYFYCDNIDFIIPTGSEKFFVLEHLSGGSITNCTIEGPVEGWQPGFSDGCYTVGCDRFTYDNTNFVKLRYGPQITQGSRFTTVKNCYAKNVRHLDGNTWPQDTLFENIKGISTDGIIQTHPSIRTTFRRVTDSVIRTGLYGLDLRGLGEIVEDCESLSTQGVGLNTNRPLLTADYISMGQEYTRRITRFNSPTAVIGCGFHGLLLVEECKVPRISIVGHSQESVIVDDKTVLTEDFADYDLGIASVNHRQPAELLTILPVDGFARSAAPTAITAVTQANPGVITSASHGLSNGEFFRVTNPTGMDELDYNYYKAANVTTDTIELNDADDNPIDTTGFVAYTSDGFIAKHNAAKVAVRANNLHVGRFPYAHYRLPKLGDGSSTITVALTTETGSSVLQKDRWGFLTVRVRGLNGLTEYKYKYTHEVFAGTTPTLTEIENETIGTGVTVTVSNETQHFNPEIIAEGGSGVIANAFDAYWSFDIALSAPADDVEVEVKEWVSASSEFQVYT